MHIHGIFVLRGHQITLSLVIHCMNFCFCAIKRKLIWVLNYQKNDFTAGIFFELFEVCGFDDIKFVSTHKLAALDQVKVCYKYKHKSGMWLKKMNIDN